MKQILQSAMPEEESQLIILAIKCKSKQKVDVEKLQISFKEK